MSVYHVSIEPLIGPSYVAAAFSDEDLSLAKREAERIFAKGEARTVALIAVKSKRKRKLIDVFDGGWLSENDWWSEENGL